MLGFVLDVLFALFIARAAWKLVQGFMEGYAGPASPPAGSRSVQSVHMSRDPVCGTFVVPDHAVSLTVGRERLYFCSHACRR